MLLNLKKERKKKKLLIKAPVSMLVNMMEKLMQDKESLRALFYPPAKIVLIKKIWQLANISEGDSILGSTSQP